MTLLDTIKLETYHQWVPIPEDSEILKIFLLASVVCQFPPNPLSPPIQFITSLLHPPFPQSSSPRHCSYKKQPSIECQIAMVKKSSRTLYHPTFFLTHAPPSVYFGSVGLGQPQSNERLPPFYGHSYFRGCWASQDHDVCRGFCKIPEVGMVSRFAPQVSRCVWISLYRALPEYASFCQCLEIGLCFCYSLVSVALSLSLFFFFLLLEINHQRTSREPS